jgi:hypothetical protein
VYSTTVFHRMWGLILKLSEIEQIQFLLGLVSVQTTEHYLGCKQKLRVAVNDRIGLEPMSASQREGVAFSDAERKMLYFSETAWTLPDIWDVSDKFDRDYDQDLYERKISGLIKNAVNRAVSMSQKSTKPGWMLSGTLAKRIAIR